LPEKGKKNQALCIPGAKSCTVENRFIPVTYFNINVSAALGQDKPTNRAEAAIFYSQKFFYI